MSDEEASFGSCVSPLFLVMGGESLLDRIVVAIMLVLVWALKSVGLFVCAVVVVISLTWDGLLRVSAEEASFGSCVSPLFLALGGESLPDRIVDAIVLVFA